MGILDTVLEAEGGVGGAAGTKRDGTHATDAMMDTMSTVSGTVPMRGLMMEAIWSCCQL